MLARGATMACPACGQRKGLFKHWTKMAESCPNCGLVFGRFEGQWIGALGINTIVSFAILLVVIIVSVALSYPNPHTQKLILLAVVVAIILPILLFPFSRTFWMGLDLMMTPLEPDEVDWTKVDPGIAEDIRRVHVERDHHRPESNEPPPEADT